MYVYLYDNFLRKKKFDSVLKSIETRLTDFGIAGKIIRLQNYTNADVLIEEEIKKGASCIVVVGNDATFGQVLSKAATCNILFGFLPVGKDNSISEVLGIPSGVAACDVLARRRKVNLDVGWFNNRYFVSKLYIASSPVSIEYDENFVVKSRGGLLELTVCNLMPYWWNDEINKVKQVIHPQDGKLEAFIRPVVGRGIIKNKFEEPSIFPFEEMVVTAKTPFAVEADGKFSKEVKVKIKLARKRIQMIVGKGRRF